MKRGSALLSSPMRMAPRAHTTKVVITVHVSTEVTMINLSALRSPAVGTQHACGITLKDAWPYDPVPIRRQRHGAPLPGAPPARGRCGHTGSVTRTGPYLTG